ncbi:hypothetical protein SCD_n00063 [Sulfuricella denitrificans skB26]|uniref:Thymidine phosphorylase n=1 Tax=Sulfuricella denitrificans (strain DSM 22764 / NBRC 105220 / skB26) TaxID=1163617 RepID=S6AZH3_SULDS|nr:DUF1631 domain-containing protein [Sulfuricella denitrificans]BAN33912.1 hypothetical protein SCD_n00063 [Sulfuricella denitrificans skB26]
MSTSSYKNVVDMSKFDKLRAVSGASGVPLLNDCRDMAAAQLAQFAAAMLDKAVNELFEQAEKSLGGEMRNLYMDGMALARDEKEAITTGFKRQFIQGFNKHIRKGKYAQPSSASSFNLAEMELSLIDLDALEESLALANITNNIHGTCAEELFGIEKRLGTLLHVHELDSADNPIGPEAIGSSFMEALKELDSSVKVKLLLVMMFNKYMPDQIKNMYQDINQHLVEKGVLPKIRVGMKKHGGSAARQPEFHAAGATGSEPTANGPDLFATLQQLVSLGNSGMAGMGVPQQAGQPGAIGGTMPSDGAAVQSAGVMSTLTKLQQGQFEGVLGEGVMLNPALLANGRTNVLREIKSSGMASVMGHVDAMTLDIVAMLFDYILDDRNIPDAMKALIGRLQIPVLKVAMLDKTFFSKKAHPARKFLDTLADAAIGWDEEEGHQGGLYKKVDHLVQRILNEFEDKVGVFADMQEELESYLAAEKERADELTGRSAQVVQTREQEEIARIMAHDEVKRRIESRKLPQIIREFLSHQWASMLSLTYQKSGEDSQAWNEALETMDQLIWSVVAKEVPDDRKKLVGLLPNLLKRLQQGMAAIDVTGDERDQFFAKLIRCHADAVKSGLRAEDEEAWQDTDIENLAEETEVVAEAPTDFEEITPSPEAPAPDLALIQQISEEPVPADFDLEEVPISDVPWQANELQNDDSGALVAKLKRGTWIEFVQADGTTSRSKLAWVSPLKGLYLFTNRLGSRALSITPSRLTEKFRSGQAQIINDEALIDRAVSDMMGRLQQVA